MIPWFEYHVIRLGPLPIQVWGLCVALGILLVFGILHREAKKKGLSDDMIFGITLRAIIWGIIGSRLFHVLFYYPDYFIVHPLEAFAIWQGGLSSFGGLCGALGSVLWDVWRKKKNGSVRGIVIADLMAYAAVFGWVVGRVGCVLIHDHPGMSCPGCVLATPWRDGVMRLDMALLEIIGMVSLGVLFFFVQRKKQMFDGWYTSVLFMYYAVLRFGLDFLRATDISGADARYFGLTPGQYSAIVILLLGAWTYWRERRRNSHGNSRQNLEKNSG